MESNSINIKPENLPLTANPRHDLLEDLVKKFRIAVEPSNEVDRVIKKMRKKFANVNPKYRNSVAFGDLLHQISKNLFEEPWYTMKELCDALEHHSMKKSLRSSTRSPTIVRVNNIEEQVELLQETLVELRNKIQTLEQSVVNFAASDDESDDENTAYIQLDRYKRRFCRLYNRICDLEKVAGVEVSKSIQFLGTKIPSINRAIEKCYNRTKEFPDFLDILEVVRRVNEKKKLGLSASQMNETGLIAFKELGQLLKLKREYELHSTIYSFIPVPDQGVEDPASFDYELAEKLSANDEIYGGKIDEIINKYAREDGKQNVPEVGNDLPERKSFIPVEDSSHNIPEVQSSNGKIDFNDKSGKLSDVIFVDLTV